MPSPLSVVVITDLARQTASIHYTARDAKAAVVAYARANWTEDYGEPPADDEKVIATFYTGGNTWAIIPCERPKRSARRRMVDPSQVAWSVNQWCEEVGGLGRQVVYNLIKSGELQTAKFGSRRVILTPPLKFLEAHRTEGLYGQPGEGSGS